MNDKAIEKIGWFAALMAVVMFASYIDQIRLNVNGKPGSIILPIATTINCIAWVCYAYLKQKKDWPIFVCNLFGVFVGALTALTALLPY